MDSQAVKSYLICQILLIFSAIILVSSENDVFHEELYIKPLDSGHVYTHFQFTTEWQVDFTDKKEFLHYDLFPKSLGEVLAAYHVQELHLSLTQGLWKYDKWGYPIRDAPPGAELWVWFQEDTFNIDETWTDLINVLSGMFCSSLNFMDSTSTVSPKFSFRPQGVTPAGYGRRSKTNLVKYAALPRENVCTENLTPWKKLLPCSSKAGIAALFNAVRLYDANFHSLSIDYRPVCKDEGCTQKGVELTLALSAVFEPVLVKGGKHPQDWSFKKLFGRQLGTSCPLATTSKVYFDITSNKTLVYYLTLTPEPDEYVTSERGGIKSRYAVYDIPHQLTLAPVLNVNVQYNKGLEYTTPEPPLLHVHRYQTGFGQEKGGITCLLYNNADQDLIITYMETTPWFLRTYLHTLNIEYFKTFTPGENGTMIRPSHRHYIPGRDREHAHQLELILRLPAASITRLSIQFERALLKWTEYPPDANHGFYVNSAVVTTLLPSADKYTATPQHSSRIGNVFNDKSSEFFLRLHSETLLVTLPTPDFSMPYNVICLACTVVAIAFGSIHNLTTRRFVEIDPTKKRGLMAKIKGLFSRKKKSDESQDENADGDDKNKGSGDGGDKNKGSGDSENVGSERDSESAGGEDTTEPKPRKRKNKKEKSTD